MNDNKETTSVTTVYSHQITVIKDDYIGKRIIKKGIYEGIPLTFIDQLLARLNNPVVFDIGANIGNHSLVFSRHAKQVFAFEPLPEIHTILAENIANNQLSNVSCHNIALSNQSGQATIYQTVAGNVGASSLEIRDNESIPQTIHCETGDDFVNKRHIDAMDFVKLDVEGHELPAIQGLQSSLSQFRPVIMLEWEDSNSTKKIMASGLMQTLLKDYAIFVLGTNYDNELWNTKPLGRLRKKIYRLFNRQRAKLYTFDPNHLYKNILLVPREKRSLLTDL